MSPSEFIHPEDAAALRQLESIPGFPSFVKGILSYGLEPLQYGINMASSVRLSETQLPKYYQHLPPICEQLGIAVPEFYLSMNPSPNAWTFGDKRVYITVTSGLLDIMDDTELDAVLAHECGHIMCHHVLYHSVAQYIISGVDYLGVLGRLTLPLQLAFLYWQRKSELSCDRAAAIVTSPEVVSHTMARLAAGRNNITDRINFDEWESMKQSGKATPGTRPCSFMPLPPRTIHFWVSEFKKSLNGEKPMSIERSRENFLVLTPPDAVPIVIIILITVGFFVNIVAIN